MEILPAPAPSDAAAAERAAWTYCWGGAERGPPATPLRCPLSPAPLPGCSRSATAARCPTRPTRPGAALRWLLRTGRRGRVSPGAHAAAGLRPPLSASFVCPAPWRRRQGLGGAGGNRRAQLARARRPQRTGLGPARGWPSTGGREAPRPLLRPLPERRPRPSLPPSLAAPRSLPPPEHLSAPSRSTLGCAPLPQALGPEPSVPSPPAGQVRPGSARLWPRPPLTWRSALTKVRYLLEGRMLPSSCFPTLVSVCPSVSCPLRTSCPPWLSALSPAVWSTPWHQTGHSLFRALRHSALRVVLHS